jgi:hypothetical protein
MTWLFSPLQLPAKLLLLIAIWINIALDQVSLLIFLNQISCLATTLLPLLFQEYSSWSGQSVNISKSNILFSNNTVASTISGIKAILPYVNTLVSAKHLGLPMLFGS